MEYDCDKCGESTNNISTCDNCQDDNLCRECGGVLENIEINGELFALCEECDKNLYEKHIKLRLLSSSTLGGTKKNIYFDLTKKVNPPSGVNPLR